MSEKIDSMRGKLDDVDRRIIDAVAERQALVAEIVEVKKVAEAVDLRDKAREEEILTRLVEQGKTAGLDSFFVTRLFREILEHSVRRQQEALVDQQNPDRQAVEEVVVGYQGTDGSYSHLAASRHFSARDVDVEFRGYDTFALLLEAVSVGGADFAVLPIENTTAGSINEAYDLLAQHDLALVGEEIQEVNHCLMAPEPVPLSHIRRIYSHPQALAQCSRFLSTLHSCNVESFLDTAMAVKKIRADQDLSQAAIASEEAARLYGLHILKRNIANQKENFTRFVVAAAKPVRYDERIACKTSTIFATRHEHGALLACLNVFAEHNLNLTKLESRPRPNTPWEYLFYVDFEGNVAEERVKEALRNLASLTSTLKVLGSYPARTTKKAQPAEPRAAMSQAPPTAASKEASDTASGKRVSTPSAVLQMLEKKPYKLASRAQRLENSVIPVGTVLIGGDRPIVIAGPCSVESRDQVMSAARAAKDLGADILRGGCFKPRTSPYSFQGLGFEGLDLLEEAGRTYGLPIVTEVLHPSDVQKVAQQSDIIQIGARNMQNFSLLKEAGKTSRPVMLKRGLMASIDEWLAAAEYILAHGNQQVILCERGIRTFETATRNTLDLSAVVVARERTHLPVIVDPSHAVGIRRWVSPMAEAAIAVGAQGIMVEIHPDPQTALSDGPQSLTYEQFGELMARVGRLAACQQGKAAESAG